MKRSFSEAEIIGVLNQQNAGQTVEQITRQHGISQATFFNRSGGPVEAKVRWHEPLGSQALEAA